MSGLDFNLPSHAANPASDPKTPDSDSIAINAEDPEPGTWTSGSQTKHTEIFQSVIERLTGIFSATNGPAKTKSTDIARPAAKLKTEPASTTNLQASQITITPTVIDLAAFAVPIVINGNPGNVSQNSSARAETKPGVDSFASASGKANAVATQFNTQGNLTNPSAGPAPADKIITLQENLSQVAVKAPIPDGNPPTRISPPVYPLPTSLEKSANETALANQAKPATGISNQPATISGGNNPVSKTRPTQTSPQFEAGTAVAKQDMNLKMPTKKTNFSESEQKLPGVTAIATRDNLPVAAGLSSNAGATKIIPSDNSMSPRAMATIPQYAEQTREQISLQVMRMHEAGGDEMRVVIKPDTGLQLSLHLQQRGAGVEVQAVLNRGNFELLNRHWPELQQRLGSRGVRVSPLANAEPSIGGGSAGFRQPTTPKGQHAGNDAGPDEVPAALITGLPPATAKVPASRISSRHLETWA